MAQQKIFTKAILDKISKHPFHSQDNKEEKEILCKVFNPYGCGTWYITEGELQENGKYIFYGYVELFENEWGYFCQEDLERKVKVCGYDMPMERDTYFNGTIDINGIVTEK